MLCIIFATQTHITTVISLLAQYQETNQYTPRNSSLCNVLNIRPQHVSQHSMISSVCCLQTLEINLSISIKMDVYVFVYSSITLERLERFQPNLVHIMLYTCVRILCVFYIYIYILSINFPREFG
jgi:hypothetical protein